ncbi:MAG: type IX secretion system sortase PorU [Bacteroidetes bacterium]|nr:type IX secretion system sortase PorU [Bacteroidota bacterium]
MNLFRNVFIIIALINVSALLAQRTTGQPKEQQIKSSSNIIASSTADSVLFKVEMLGAQYDITQKNMPYYLISKNTFYNQNARPTLIVKRISIVAEPHASVIKKYFSKYLTNNFELIAKASLSKGENLNHHQLFPFRLNTSGQIEELIEYSVNWQVTTDNLRKPASAASFKNNSVLASGNWYKIGITKTGFHKIDKTFLSSCGINIAGLNPKNIRIYGNGGKMLAEKNSDFRYDDLEENAIQVVGENDGVFNDADYVLFYANDATGWKNTKSTSTLKFTNLKNTYSDTSFYFINVDQGAGKRIATIASSTLPQNITSTSYDYYNFHEKNQLNFIKSGREFYGEYFDITNLYSFTFNEGSFELDTIMAETLVAGRGIIDGKYSVSGNNLSGIITTTWTDINYYLADYANPGLLFSKAINSDPNIINISVTKQTPTTIGWLDKITVNARRKLVINSKQFEFRDTRVVLPGNMCDYILSNPANLNATIWNVTDPINPFMQSYTSGTGVIDFIANSDSLNVYAVHTGTDLYLPTFIGKTQNQNLHNLQQADYVLITPPIFLSQAQRLATLHQQQEGYTYAIATTDQVYNEFSSGRTDAAAIRDFIRMLYSRNIASGKQVKYVVLVGDGSYNNLNHNTSTNSCLIPTYQTNNSTSFTQSAACDDFFGLMDPNEGFNTAFAGAMDIGVGRLTCRNLTEVTAVVNKIENYYRKDPNFKPTESTIENCNTQNELPLGDWRNWMVFLADDGDAARHMIDADDLSSTIKNSYPNYNIDKIYLDAYQQFSTPGGQRYPDAAEDLLRRFKKGALVFNYTGHGGEVGITDERILDVPAINSLDNFNKLPLFVTATCEFSRYDDPDRTSAGELCLLNPKGGSIALLTTCRVAYSPTNKTLNQTLLTYLFKKLPNAKMPALGDVMQKMKAALGQNIYFVNFHLLGDPALTLAYPQQNIVTSKINNHVVTSATIDTLGALAKVTITGFVSDTLGNKLSNFNGVVYSSVFDKEQNVSCLINDIESAIGGAPFAFNLQKNILYRGKSTVTNGDFSFAFVVPKDISFAIGPGKISYYATNGVIDASGATKNIKVGGGSNNPLIDDDGPQAAIYLNDKNFVNGGTTNEKPILYATLSDSSGINTLGSSIGHDLSVILDENSSKPIILNDYYEADLNSYQKGKVRYAFDELPEGNHRLTFKAWDIQNNSNTVSTDFVVAPSAELALKHVLNYPNPFTTNTKFYLEHNQACNPLKITIQIFTISGKVVKTIQRTVTCEGFRPEGVDWDGKDEYGDKLGRGVYVYKLAIINTDNKKAEKTEKLVILN